MSIRSKLPRVGTTIFTVMSRRAQEVGAINLGQGFPDYDIDPRLGELVHEAMRGGHNQYAPMPGLPQLREALAAKLARSHAARFDPELEITVTLGATEAIYSAVQALVGPGDEAVVFDPAYDSYEPAIELAGGTCVHVPLSAPHFRYDWERVAAALSARTRVLIVNSPHNPACTCLRAEDLVALAQLIRGRDIYLIADEVYEHMVFDGLMHQSVLSSAELRERSIAIYSFGKTLHATGLRVGYAVAPPALTAELRKVHQFNTFTIATALQWAIARYLAERPQMGTELAPFFAAKRDRFIAALAGTGWSYTRAEGSYFQLIDYGAISTARDIQFADTLVSAAGVATIPLSVFYQQPPQMTLLRVCIAKRDETLAAGAARLAAFASAQGPSA
ncbi:MAG TPA: methionine aminotransferase [Steroidobacteraceae bacterium]|jgi:methionine aminotransferase|nr:methionine aminotransferase [Steroidobacteraceae bacterium]